MISMIASLNTTRYWFGLAGPLLSLCLLLTGCGKTTSQSATDQLLQSSAIDRAIQKIDFTPLARQKVYLDDQFIRGTKVNGYVNSDYVISSLRQQIMAANCLIMERKEDAEYIIEARVGTLGNDQHEINYGIPANNMLSTASNAVSVAPQIPVIPEISLAKREHRTGAAKIGVFAYHQETREPVWQAGVRAERARSRDSWFLGIGPYQSGTIYEEPMFAGGRIDRPVQNVLIGKGRQKSPEPMPPVDYQSPYLFPLAYQLKAEQQKKGDDPKTTVDWANHQKTQEEIRQLLQQIEAETKTLAPPGGLPTPQPPAAEPSPVPLGDDNSAAEQPSPGEQDANSQSPPPAPPASPQPTTQSASAEQPWGTPPPETEPNSTPVPSGHSSLQPLAPPTRTPMW